MQIASSLGVVLGLGLTVFMARAFYINYRLSKARRAAALGIQPAPTRVLSMQERRRNSRRVARSGRAREDYVDLETGLREPPPVHFAREDEDPLPLYEPPPEYSAIAKPGQRRMELLSDDIAPLERIDLYQSESHSSSSSSSASSSPSSPRSAIAPIRGDPPLYSVAIR